MDKLTLAHAEMKYSCVHWLTHWCLKVSADPAPAPVVTKRVFLPVSIVEWKRVEGRLQLRLEDLQKYT